MYRSTTLPTPVHTYGIRCCTVYLLQRLVVCCRIPYSFTPLDYATTTDFLFNDGSPSPFLLLTFLFIPISGLLNPAAFRFISWVTGSGFVYILPLDLPHLRLRAFF